MIEFEIPGTPIAKGRPRFARVGKFVRTYTPDVTLNFENLVKASAAIAMADRAPLQGALEVVILAGFPIPKSWSKRKRAEAESLGVPHTVKPDADNLAKSVLDGMAGVAFESDAQVAKLTVSKLYSATPRTVVGIAQWKPE